MNTLRSNSCLWPGYLQMTKGYCFNSLICKGLIAKVPETINGSLVEIPIFPPPPPPQKKVVEETTNQKRNRTVTAIGPLVRTVPATSLFVWPCVLGLPRNPLKYALPIAKYIRESSARSFAV